MPYPSGTYTHACNPTHQPILPSTVSPFHLLISLFCSSIPFLPFLPSLALLAAVRSVAHLFPHSLAFVQYVKSGKHIQAYYLYIQNPRVLGLVPRDKQYCLPLVVSFYPVCWLSCYYFSRLFLFHHFYHCLLILLVLLF